MKSDDLETKVLEFKLGELEVSGNFTLNGERTALEIHTKFDLSKPLAEQPDLLCLNVGSKKYSLVDCVVVGSSTTFGKEPHEAYHYYKVFPHYVISGNKSLTSTAKTLSGFSFVIQDSTTLFYDWGAFGMLLDKEVNAKSFLESISTLKKEVVIGDHPEIFYYTGKWKIFEVETQHGIMSASHAPTVSSPSPNGIHVNNKVTFNVKFSEPKSFLESLKIFHPLVTFLEIMTGKPQEILEHTVYLENENGFPKDLDVKSCMAPIYKENIERPHPSDVLINGGMEPIQFGEVLKNWIHKEEIESWANSRTRFIQSFRMQSYLNIDRVVAVSNMFDILPSSAIGPQDELDGEVLEALEKAKELFKPLTKLKHVQSILTYFGSVGTHNLRSKIKSRLTVIRKVMPEILPDVELIIDEAVASRNFYVHGKYKGKLTKDEREYFADLFIYSLEFIFEASDLIECGWDFKAWKSKGSGLSHPYALYLYTYKQALPKFIACLNKKDQ